MAAAGGGARARPDGSATEPPSRYTGAAARWVELLGEAVPDARRVSILLLLAAAHPDAAAWSTLAEATGHAARRRALRPEIMTARHRGELLDVFVMMRQSGIDAVVVLPTPLALARAAEVAAQASRHRLPLIGGHRRFVDSGALMAYGPGRADGRGIADAPHAGRAAAQDGGPAPAFRFELVINGKVARALGLRITPSLRQRADRIIE